MTMAKKRTRRSVKQVRHEVWEDRVHRARPTLERLRKGKWRLEDTEAAGVTVAVDAESCELDRLAARGVITAEQRQAGLDYTELMRRTRLIGEGRSCIDFSPVGHDPDVYDDSGEIRDSQDRKELYLACGMMTWAELRRVCVEDRRPRDVARLREGLDVCERFFGR